MSVSEQSHPRPSLLQNPQRIVADGPFAVNEAVRKANETMEREMGKITGGMNIPGLGGLGL